MLALNLLVVVFLCLGAIVVNVEAFHSRYFDSYEEDWRARHAFKRQVGPVVSESVEVPIEEVRPIEVVPASYESDERYARSHYGRPSYYEPRPVYGGSSYGYRPHYGKK